MFASRSAFGPAFLVAIAYIDPGNLDADISAVSGGQSELLWTLLWATLLGGAWQMVTVWLTITSGRDLATLIGAWYGGAATIIWASSELACVSVGVQELLGASIFFEELFGIPRWGGILISSCEIFAVLALLITPTRSVERAFVVGMLVATGGAIALASGSHGVRDADVLADVLLPRVPHTEAVVPMVALLGSVVMPHNLFLHSALVFSSAGARSARAAWLAHLADLTLALGCALIINLGVSLAFLDTSAATLANSTAALVARYGSAASLLWPLALLVSSAASAGTTAIAGGIMLRCVGVPVPFDRPANWQRAVLARVVALVPALVVALLAPVGGLSALNAVLDVVQCATLPFILVPVVQLAARARLTPALLALLCALALPFGAALGATVWTVCAAAGSSARALAVPMSCMVLYTAALGTVLHVGRASLPPTLLRAPSASTHEFAMALNTTLDAAHTSVSPSPSPQQPRTHSAADEPLLESPPPTPSARAASGGSMRSSFPTALLGPLLSTPPSEGAHGAHHGASLLPASPSEGPPAPCCGRGSLFDAALCLLAAINGVLFGYDLGVISGALGPLAQHFGLGVFEQELLVSVLLAGALLGSPAGGLLGDKLGRRPALLVASSLYFQGTLMEAFAETFCGLLVGRTLVGVGVGVGGMVAPLLVSELARPRLRGALVAVNELAIACGVLLAFAGSLPLDGDWRMQLGLAAVPALMQFVCCAAFPESPKFLVSVGRHEEARATVLDCRQRVLWLWPGPRGERLIAPDVLAELASLDEDRVPLDDDDANGGGGGRGGGGGGVRGHGMCAPDAIGRGTGAPSHAPDAPRRKRGRVLAVGMGLTICQQLTGQPTLMSYAHGIFADAGIEGASSVALATIGLGMGKLAGTALTIARVDQWGRRRFLLAGQLGMQLGLALLLASFGFRRAGIRNGATSALAVGGLAIFFSSYSAGYGPVTWIVLSEIFPVAGRARAMSAAIAVNWLANVLVSLTFLSLSQAMGSLGVFGLYFGMGLGALAFCYLLVPETLHQSPEELHKAVATRWRHVFARARPCS